MSFIISPNDNDTITMSKGGFGTGYGPWGTWREEIMGPELSVERGRDVDMLMIELREGSRDDMR
jgi:hypothetical protein